MKHPRGLGVRHPGMKTAFGIVLWAAAALTMAGAEVSGKPGIEALAWLAGRWEFEQDGRVVREEWMPPAGGTMLGMSRTTQAGRTIEYEFIHLAADAQGELVYTSTPSGQARTSFRLLELDDRLVLFENKRHDFPQRIGYKLHADGSLTAFIEGDLQGRLRRVEFPYRPVR